MEDEVWWRLTLLVMGWLLGIDGRRVLVEVDTIGHGAAAGLRSVTGPVTGFGR